MKYIFILSLFLISGISAQLDPNMFGKAKTDADKYHNQELKKACDHLTKTGDLKKLSKETQKACRDATKQQKKK